ncbi:nuclear transport factor 2 family protein [Oryzibacter oryziterrae]|uniref:nuclear transport factor 2 family protein n=1 Tax=Oryzibacter oryziterrae TaxID=2766474 RepID=UPI001F164881|nr:nuclear transport factor 2 family protein [Oryzibacter oryziterrae]
MRLTLTALALTAGLMATPAAPALADDTAAILAKQQANKELVVKAYQELFGDKDMSSLDRYFREDYFQHNPTVPSGREALRKALLDWGFDKAPKTRLNFLRTAADGDLVWLYSIYNDGKSDSAVVDIFRVQDGKIAEHWDVAQPIPATTVSGNSMTGDMK